MTKLVSDRVKKLREEIAEISEANRAHINRRDAGAVAKQERRLQRLLEIVDELMSLTDWKKAMNIREAHEKLATDEQCLQYIQQMRWPDGVLCCPYRQPRRQEWVHEESFPFVDDLLFRQIVHLRVPNAE